MQLTDILKWMATSILITGSLVNSLGIYPAGIFILIIGGLLWLTVSILWREPALIVTNLVMTSVTIIGLMINFFFLQ